MYHQDKCTSRMVSEILDRKILVYFAVYLALYQCLHPVHLSWWVRSESVSRNVQQQMTVDVDSCVVLMAVDTPLSQWVCKIF